jgi:endonuclease/exonuclease/phosphatase family metal-dependent hydrolase
MRHIAVRILGTALLIAGALLTACTSSGGSAQDAAPPAVTEPPPTATPAPLLTLKIVTYNILFGGGRDRTLDEHIAEDFRGIDRTPLLIEYLRELDADIVGLQETTGWDQGSPPYIETFADQLDMNYFVSTGRSDSSLLTKLEILEAEDLSNEVNSIVRVRLLGADDEPINVFVAHLNSDSRVDRACGTQFLLQEMQPYVNQRTFLIGDMNFPAKGGTEWGLGALKASGWQLIATSTQLSIDHIWAPDSLRWDASAWKATTGVGLNRLSDHMPVGVELDISSPSGALLPVAAVTPTPMPELQGVPDAVAAKISNLRVAYAGQAESACSAQTWNPDWSYSNYWDGLLRVYGTEDWQAGANWSKYIPEGSGMMLDFKYDPASEFNIFLEHGAWATPEFRKFGPIIGADGQLYADMWQGETPLGGDSWAGISKPKPDTWYRLLLLAGKDASLRGFVWEIADPSNLAAYEREMGADWAGLTWRLSTGANRGSSYIKDVVQVVFDSLE